MPPPPRVPARSLLRAALGVALLAMAALPSRAGAEEPGKPAGSLPMAPVVLETSPASGLMEPPLPRELEFTETAAAGTKAPAAVGALRIAKFVVTTRAGVTTPVVVGVGGPPDAPRVHVDPNGDGNLSDSGTGETREEGGFRVREVALDVGRAPEDPENHSTVPLAIVGSDDSPRRWYVVSIGRRRVDVPTTAGTRAAWLLDADGDGAYGDGDLLWIDANGDGAFSADPAARERLALPAIARLGDRVVRITSPWPSGARLDMKEDRSGAPADGPARPAPNLLSWRIAFAAASPTDPAARAAAVAGAATSKEDGASAWLAALLKYPEQPVRLAALKGLADPSRGADKAEKALEAAAAHPVDSGLRVEAIKALAGHPGKDALAFLGKVADSKTHPPAERGLAIRSMAAFSNGSSDLAKRMKAQDAPWEVRIAAYEELAKRTPDDLALHAYALDMGHPAARSGAIAAFWRLRPDRAVQIARKEIEEPRFGSVRAACVKVLVATGKPADLDVALARAEDRDGGVRDALRDALVAQRDRPDVRAWALNKALGAESILLRRTGLDVLQGIADPPVREAVLQRIAKETDRDLKLRLLGLAAQSKGEAPVAVLLDLAKSDDETIRGAASSAAVDAAIADPRVRALVLSLLTSSRWPERVQGAEAAARGTLAEAVPALVENLKHERWSVRLAAVEALVAIHPKEATGPLVELMSREGFGSRLGRAAGKALFRLTGMDLPDDADQWRAWLMVHPEFGVPDQPPTRPPDTGRTSARFFGLAIESARVVLVVDRSNSMGNMDPAAARGGRRWDAVRAEAAAVVRALPKGALVNLVAFGREALPFRPRSASVDATLREAATKWLEELEPEGTTNVWGGLLAGLEDPDADTIVLLTDGEPTAGEFTSAGDILRETAARNRWRRMAISTVSVGRDSDFLKELARQNGGTYVRR